MLRIENVRLPIEESEDSLRERCARLLKLRPAEIQSLRILRKSLDVRDKRRFEHVYTVAVVADDEARLLKKIDRPEVRSFEPKRFEEPLPGRLPLNDRPVVVGAGPAGLLAAYLLAEYGYAPIVLERGPSVRERTRDVRDFDRGGPLDPDSNYLFGEGGAGAFSDGKLTCRNTGPDTDRVLQILAECKGKPSIVYESKPHLGSNRLPAVVKALRQKIQAMGGEFRFRSRLDDLKLENGAVGELTVSGERLRTQVCVLGIGHSARDTYAMLLARGVAVVARAFQMGVRIEQPQANVNRFRYGSGPQAALVGAADYNLQCRAGDRDLFSFCMCAGGYVMPSVSQHGHFCSNGMSRSGHESPFANSGMVVTVEPASLAAMGLGKDPLVGLRYQGVIEREACRLAGGDYQSPIQWARDFIAQRPSKGVVPSSYARGVRNVNLWDFLPSDLARVIAEGLPMLDRRWKGLFLDHATLVGPEARGSCPVRLVRDDRTRESVSVDGLYPIGEGAGYAGGIVSAAVDGLRTARTIIQKYRPLVR
jgi:uncharacterized FAD-dependent dehydrogenase